MSGGILQRLTIVPFILALILAGGLYLARNPLGRGMLEDLLETYADTRLSAPVSVDIGALEGSWWNSFTLRDVSVHNEGNKRLIFSAREVSAGFFLPGLLSGTPFLAFDSFTLKQGRTVTPFPSLRPEADTKEISELTDRTVRPEHPLTTALRLYPLDMYLDVDLVVAPGSEATSGVAARLRLQGRGSDGISGAISLRAVSGPLARLDTVSSDFVLTGSAYSLEIVPAGNPAPDSMLLNARLEADAGNGGILLFEAGIEYRGVSFALSADAGELSASLDLTEEAGPELVKEFLPVDASIEPGTGDARLRLRRNARADYSVVELLAANPRRLLEQGDLSIDLELAGWDAGAFEDLQLKLRSGFQYPLFTLHRLSVEAPGGLDWNGAGEWNLESGEVRTERVSFVMPELEKAAAFFTSDASGAAFSVAGSLSGSLELSLNTRERNLLAIGRSIAGSLLLNAENLHLGGFEAGSASLRGVAEEGRLELRHLKIESDTFHFSASGSAAIDRENPSVKISQAMLVSDVLNSRRIELTNAAVLTFGDGQFGVSNSIVDLAGGEISLKGEYRNGTISLVTAGSDFSPSRIARIVGLDFPVEGNISWRGRVEGPLAGPRFSFYLESNKMSYEEEPVNLLLSISQNERGLRLDQFNFSLGAWIELQGRGEIPFIIDREGFTYTSRSEPSLLGITITAPDLLSRIPAAGLIAELPKLSLNGEFRLEEREGLLSASIALLGEDSSGDTVGGVNGRFEQVSLDFALREQPGMAAGLSGSVTIDKNQVSTLDAQLTGPDPREGRLPTSPAELGLTGQIMLDVPLGYLAAYLPQLVYSQGSISGEVSFSGPLSAIELQGAVDLQGAELHPAGSMPAVTSLNGRFKFGSDGVIRVREIKGELGRAPFTVTGRAALFPGANDGGIDLAFQGSNLLIYSDPDLRIRSDAQIEITGSRTDPAISGMVVLTEALYSKDIPLVNMNTPPAVDAEALQLFSIGGPTASRTSLDLDIRSDRTILIDNNIFAGRLSTDLHLTGNLQVPVLTGRVFGDDARLSLPVSSVDLNQLVVEFPEDSPFKPRLQVQGTSQVSGYEIFIQAYGSVPTVEIEVSSSPTLPQDQALLLLTTGFADLGGGAAGERTVRSLGTYLGRQLFDVLFGSNDSDNRLLERVEVSVGRQISSSGSEVIDVEFQLAEGENWYLQFERDRYDQVNLGVAWRLWFN